MEDVSLLDLLPMMGPSGPSKQREPKQFRRWLLRHATGALFLPRPAGKLARLLYLNDMGPIPKA